MQVKPLVNPTRTSSIALHPQYREKFNASKPIALVNDKHIYFIEFAQRIALGEVQIGMHTKVALFQMDDPTNLILKPFESKVMQRPLDEITFYLGLQKRPPQVIEILASQLQRHVRGMDPLLNNNTNFNINFKGLVFQVRPEFDSNISYATLKDETILNFKREMHQRIQIIEDNQNVDQLFQNIESKVKNLKVGGLQSQLQLIDRRVFGTRMLHPKMVRKMGLKHIKGMLLYGPPGTGKTLVARQISKILMVEPKIVNGPEIFNEFVGQSEKKIRQLFADAIRDQLEKGAKSQLHCIIFDEIDALCKKRGLQTSNGVYDQIVNQLLTCIDGINGLNNILVIGITNRKDLIDEAVLRPGRLEVHIEFNIPDEAGRYDVLQIHCQTMKKNGLLGQVNLKEIAKITKNYTGAELEGVVKSAQSFALEKWKKLPQSQQTADQIKVNHEDFLKGITQVYPQFGKDNKILETIVPRQKFKIAKYQRILENLASAIKSVQRGKHTFLIRGNSGVGKSVLAAQCALANDCSFIKLVNADRFLGINQHQVMNEIVRIFDDADKCNSSFIVLDDVLRLIDFIPLGPRYNATILNLLINLLKKVLHPDKKQIIVATVTNAKEFEELGLMKYFQHNYFMDKLKADQISDVLQCFTMSSSEANAIGREVQTGTIQQLISISNITQNQGKIVANKWLGYWKATRNQYI